MSSDLCASVGLRWFLSIPGWVNGEVVTLFTLCCISHVCCRQKSGIWGFRSDKVEKVNGVEAKVFTATGVEMVTRTRVEHLPEDLKKKSSGGWGLTDGQGNTVGGASQLGRQHSGWGLTVRRTTQWVGLYRWAGQMLGEVPGGRATHWLKFWVGEVSN